MTQFPLQRETTSRTLVSVQTDARPAGTRALARDSWLLRFAKNLAPQDWYIAGYFVVMMLAVVFACLVTGLALTRGGLLRPGSFANSLLYRLTVWLAVFLSYFQLRHIL